MKTNNYIQWCEQKYGAQVSVMVWIYKSVKTQLLTTHTEVKE